MLVKRMAPMRRVRDSVAIGFLLSLVSPLLSYIGHGLKIAWVLYAIWLFLIYCGRPQAAAKTIAEVRRCSIECFMPMLWWYVILLDILFSRGLTGNIHLVDCTAWLMALMSDRTDAQREAARAAALASKNYDSLEVSHLLQSYLLHERV